MDEPELDQSSDSRNSSCVELERSFFFEFPTSSNQPGGNTQDPLKLSTQLLENNSPSPEKIEFCSTGLRPIITYTDRGAILCLPNDSFTADTMKTESNSMDSQEVGELIRMQEENNTVVTAGGVIDETRWSMNHDQPQTDMPLEPCEKSFSSTDEACSLILDEERSSSTHRPLSGIVQCKVEIIDTESASDSDQNVNDSHVITDKTEEMEYSNQIVLVASTNTINESIIPNKLTPSKNIRENTISQELLHISLLQLSPTVSINYLPSKTRLKMECPNQESLVDVTNDNNNSTSTVSNNEELIIINTDLPQRLSIEMYTEDSTSFLSAEPIVEENLVDSDQSLSEDKVDCSPLRKRIKIEHTKNVSFIDLSNDDPHESKNASPNGLNTLKIENNGNHSPIINGNSFDSYQMNVIEGKSIDVAQQSEYLSDYVYISDSDETDDSDRIADENRDEAIRQYDLQQGSQRILDEDSDTDNELPAQRSVAEEIVLSGGHWNDECSQLMRQCGLGTSNSPHSDLDNNCFLAPQIPVTHKRVTDKTLEELLNTSSVNPSPPMSSQLVDIEMAALAKEIVTSEEEWQQIEQQFNNSHEVMDVLEEEEGDEEEQTVGVSTKIDIEEGLLQSIVRKPSTIVSKQNSRNRTTYADPLPLMIDDVLQLLTAPIVWSAKLARFGFRFTQVAVYGRCIQMPFSMQGRPNPTLRRLYEVDDGTAAVSVIYDHFSKQRTEFYKEVQQVERNLTSKRNDIDKTTYAHLRCLMRDIRSNDRMPIERPFEMGINVLVIGRPFWNEFRQQVQISAFEMYADGQCSRDLEIAFKMNMANMYETRYDLRDLGDSV